MTNSTKCPRCGNDLPVNFPPGVCPSCLMQQGLSPSTFNSVAGLGKGGAERRRGWIPPTPAELAPRFPQLEIIELLGQGGMGAVYKVRQRDLDRWAALKILPEEVAHDPNFSERFQREARALALLGHQHIVIVYEFGQRDGVFFLLMEYIDGVTLRQAIRARQVTDRDALAIVAQICEALQFAHEEGVVHRDIKPENILIDKRGRVKIADFGLAKLLGRAFEVPTLTGTHQVMGTPVYMAPEQMEGTRGVDHRADIFSLGVVFYELLTGELPLGRFAPPSQKYQLDALLDEVVLRTLEKEPDRRYQHASDVKVDVESIRSQPRVELGTQSMRAPTIEKKPRQRWTWRKRITVFALGGVGILLNAFILGIVISENHHEVRALVNRDQQLQQENQRLQDEIDTARTQIQNANEKLIAREQKPPTKVTSHDPNEQNAVVQFTPDEPRLNPAFGTNHPQFSGPQRDAVNRILVTVHNEFLAIERRHVQWEKQNNGSQVSIVERFDDEIKQLENWFWKAIDSQLPVGEQKFLRQELPLYADLSRPLPTIIAPSTEITGQNLPAAYYPQNQSGEVEPMAFPTNMRYLQIFGWKQDLTEDDVRQGRRDPFPIRVTIGRHGNWYRWSIEISRKTTVTTDDETSVRHESDVVDSGYDPELPSGLRRFWRDDESAEPKLPSMQEPEVNLTAVLLERRRRVESLDSAPVNGEEFGRRFNSSPAAELDPTDAFVQPRRNRDQPIEEPQEQSVDQFSTPAENDLDESEQIRRRRNRDPELMEEEAIAVEVVPQRPVGRHQQSQSFERESTELDDFMVSSEMNSDEIKRRIDVMLRNYPGRVEQGRIYCKAVAVFSGKRLRWHAADVTRYALEGLKRERNLSERSRLFLALGIAAEIHDNDPTSFVESRAEATHWYLKGYAELLPFHLPDQAPELPTVEPVNENVDDAAEDEINPERIAAELRNEAQMNLRKQAEFIRDLVERRDAYLGRLKELFGLLHQANDKQATARDRLNEIAIEVLRNPKDVEKLLVAVVGPPSVDD